MATKTKSVAAEMEALGFPYEATHPAQMANMIATGSRSHGMALVATVDVNDKPRMFVGYYSADEAREVGAKARRVRRLRVTSVVLLPPAEVSF